MLLLVPFGVLAVNFSVPIYKCTCFKFWNHVWYLLVLPVYIHNGFTYFGMVLSLYAALIAAGLSRCGEEEGWGGWDDPTGIEWFSIELLEASTSTDYILCISLGVHASTIPHHDIICFIFPVKPWNICLGNLGLYKIEIIRYGVDMHTKPQWESLTIICHTCIS